MTHRQISAKICGTRLAVGVLTKASGEAALAAGRADAVVYASAERPEVAVRASATGANALQVASARQQEIVAAATDRADVHRTKDPVRLPPWTRRFLSRKTRENQGRMAELADAQDLKSCGG